jgi:hypothetical protein
MCASWSKVDNDWLITHYEELTAAREDFMSLVTKSPLVLEEVDQALNSLAARLVCLLSVSSFCSHFLHYVSSNKSFKALAMTQEVCFRP